MTAPDPDPLLVLVAEDEALASMALRAQLEALDYRVLGPARNGDEAVALGACHPVDLALLDYRMPGRTGLQAALDLYALAPTPAVLLTGMGSADLPDPLPTPPVFGFLGKPTGLDDLATGLRDARNAFLQWRDDHPDARLEHETGLDQRRTIARAVEAMRDDHRPAAAAARILQRAHDEGRSPAAIANDILLGASS